MIAVKFLRAWFFLLPFAGEEYNYDNPNNWTSKYPTCGGRRQSPIPLFFHKSIYSRLSPISFHSYDVPLTLPLQITNNGHTISATIESTIDGNRPSISAGGVIDVYEVQSLHFHWGSPNQKGSEHAINGRKFDLEMHIVHKNTKFTTFEEAQNDPFGLAVLGILFKAVQNKNISRSGINEFYDVLPKLSRYNSTEALNKTITMHSILGDLNTKQFFTYRGSLTTPPCSEAVTWFVFPDILPIHTSNLYKFFTLYDSRNIRLLNNFRPLQRYWYREVHFRKGKHWLQ